MAATGLLCPKQQFFDDAGVVLAGGKVYFYQAGTDTPQNTYSESALSVANANPVILDAAGRAVIYMLTTPAYKVVLKTSAGVQLWSQDNVSAADVAD